MVNECSDASSLTTGMWGHWAKDTPANPANAAFENLAQARSHSFYVESAGKVIWMNPPNRWLTFAIGLLRRKSCLDHNQQVAYPIPASPALSTAKILSRLPKRIRMLGDNYPGRLKREIGSIHYLLELTFLAGSTMACAVCLRPYKKA